MTSGRAIDTYPRASRTSNAYDTIASVAVNASPARSTRWYSSVPTYRYRRSYARLAAERGDEGDRQYADSTAYPLL